MEAPSAHDPKAGFARGAGDRGESARVGSDERLVVFASGRERGLLARKAAAAGDLVEVHIAEAPERQPGRGADGGEGAPELGVGPAIFDDVVAAVPPSYRAPDPKYPSGTKTAPPFSTTKGCVLPRARRQRSVSARVLLVQKTTGTPAAARASSAGRAGSNEYVAWSRRVPSRSVIDDQGTPLHAGPSVNDPTRRAGAETARSHLKGWAGGCQKNELPGRAPSSRTPRTSGPWRGMSGSPRIPSSALP